MEKTRVVFIVNSQYEGEYNVGDRGYVDGYCRGGDDIPYAVVVKDDGHFVLATISSIKKVAE